MSRFIPQFLSAPFSFSRIPAQTTIGARPAENRNMQRGTRFSCCARCASLRRHTA